MFDFTKPARLKSTKEPVEFIKRDYDTTNIFYIIYNLIFKVPYLSGYMRYSSQGIDLLEQYEIENYEESKVNEIKINSEGYSSVNTTGYVNGANPRQNNNTNTIDWTKPVRSIKCKNQIRVLCTDKLGTYPIVGILKTTPTSEKMESFTKDGRVNQYGPIECENYDPEEKEKKEERKFDPTKPFKVRNNKVEILHFYISKLKETYPIHVIYKYKSHLHRSFHIAHTFDGRFFKGNVESEWDLVNIEE